MTLRVLPGRCSSSSSSFARSWTVTAVLTCALTLSCGPETDSAGSDGQSGAPDTPRNLVIVVLDTVRADHLGLYGYTRDTTPHLDRFAAPAVVFENAQSAAPWTAPALISLMTSLYPAVHQVREFPNPKRISPRVTTLAQALHTAGFQTAAFTEGGYAKGDFGLDAGVDHFPPNPGDAQSHKSNMHFPSRLGANTQRAIDWLRERDEQPFFLFFQTYEAHTPYRAPAQYIRALRPSYDEAAEHARLRSVIERWNAGDPNWGNADSAVMARHEHHCSLADMPAVERLRELAALRRSFPPPSAKDSDEFIQWLRDLYDAEILYTDERLSALWKTLEEEGLLADTLVVVVSDHGEGFGEHAAIGHGRLLHEELLRVALILRAPGIAGRRLEPLVRSVDVMPTVLDLLGIQAPAAMQGTSLAPWLRGASAAPRLASYSHALSVAPAVDRFVSIRVADWRLLVVDGTRERALFDLANDPGETIDVASQHPDRARELFEQLEQQKARDAALRAELGPALQLAAPGEDSRAELEALGYIESQ